MRKTIQFYLSTLEHRPSGNFCYVEWTKGYKVHLASNDSKQSGLRHSRLKNMLNV